MQTDKVVGRRVGMLLLAQMACALIIPFVLIGKLAAGYPAYLETAANSSTAIRAGIAVALLGAGCDLCLTRTRDRLRFGSSPYAQ